VTQERVRDVERLYEYDALSQLERVDIRKPGTSGQGLYMAFAYDNQGRTDNIDYAGVSGHAGLKSIDPPYDGLSWILGLALTLKSGSLANQTYGFPEYTPASEIARQTSFNSAYTYQPAENATDIYDAVNGLNQLTKINNGPTIDHDAGGRVSMDHKGRSFKYSAEGHLWQINVPGQSVREFGIYPDGQPRRRLR